MAGGERYRGTLRRINFGLSTGCIPAANMCRQVGLSRSAENHRMNPALAETLSIDGCFGNQAID